ncbi:LptF/LptG family permease [Blattabacterium cuenoti]|uniref:LptF/LptG family permease n=1 Tax=Blattabacterium cuenoti TaxID=1653831 RepID=UPI00163D11B1|nr:LptF/LptG family permease [Blattabacterium cuenoti]
MKILDRYIIRNLFLTFIFITVSMQFLSVVIDVSQRMSRLEDNHGSIKDALIFYYPFWAIWLSNTFSPISIFLSVIFFTSRLEKNLEITAIISNGISFNRLSFPYLISALIIGIISLIINYYFLPIANKKKNEFYYQYLLSPRYKEKYENNQSVSIQISKNGYIFMKKFFKKKNLGKYFVYQKFDDNNKLIFVLKSKYIFWDKKNKIYILFDYIETTLKNNNNFRGDYKIIKLPIAPKEFLPEEYAAENMNISELRKFLSVEKKNKNINIYLNEYYQRTSLPFSTFIFTILGLSLSSKRKKNDIGIFIGIMLSIFYIFFIEFSKMFSIKNLIPSFLSIWIPNIILGIITLFFYLFWGNNK